MFNFISKKWLPTVLCIGLITCPAYAQNNGPAEELNDKIDNINIYISDLIFRVQPMSVSAGHGVKQTITTYFDKDNKIRAKEIVDYDKQGLLVKVNSQMILFSPEFVTVHAYIIVSKEKDQVLAKEAHLISLEKKGDCLQYDNDGFCLKINENLIDFKNKIETAPLTDENTIDCEQLRKNTKHDCILDANGRLIEKYPANIPFFLRYHYDAQGRISRNDLMVKDPKVYFVEGYQPTERDIYKYTRKWKYTQEGYLSKEYRWSSDDRYVYEYDNFDKNGLWTTGTLTINDMFSSTFKREIIYY